MTVIFFGDGGSQETACFAGVFCGGLREVVVAERGKCVVRLWWIAWQTWTQNDVIL
jgi:hypothetical protein